MDTLQDQKIERRIIKLYWIFASVVAGYALLIAVKFALWIFMFDTFRIPTDSMTPSLIPGDKILVSKQILGARLYESLDSAAYSLRPKTYLVGGYRTLRHNEIVVFNFPYPNQYEKIGFRINYVYCKRCIGLPGDTLWVRDGFYRNNNYSEQLGLRAEQQVLSETADSTMLDYSGWFAAGSERTGRSWTIKELGPLVVPGAGRMILLDSTNWRYYRAPIEYESGSELSCDARGALSLNGSVLTSFIFSQNYYFMAGDNVLNSNDSRYWGFVPQQHIVGVVTHILYSIDPQTGRLRWDRLWRSV